MNDQDTSQEVQTDVANQAPESLQTHTNEQEGALVPAEVVGQPPPSLTPKNRLFLSILLDNGGNTLDAYHKAGYKGNAHAAYTLRARLRHELTRMAEARGMDEAGLLTDILRINSLPLTSQEITPKEYINLLKLRHKIIADKRDNLTAKPSPVFIKADKVNIGNPDAQPQP